LQRIRLKKERRQRKQNDFPLMMPQD
jgi:hypothetical protein